MNQTEILPDSTIGKPAPFDRDQLVTYRDALRRLLLNLKPSYKKDLLQNEWLEINNRIRYYDENKIAYNL